jgi:hypothetical protein
LYSRGHGLTRTRSKRGAASAASTSSDTQQASHPLHHDSVPALHSQSNAPRLEFFLPWISPELFCSATQRLRRALQPSGGLSCCPSGLRFARVGVGSIVAARRRFVGSSHSLANAPSESNGVMLRHRGYLVICCALAGPPIGPEALFLSRFLDIVSMFWLFSDHIFEPCTSNLALVHDPDAQTLAPLRCGGGKGHPECGRKRCTHTKIHWPGHRENIVVICQQKYVEHAAIYK